MKQKTWLIHYLQLLAIAGIAVFIFLAIASWSNPVHALPEYAKRTGESCATCHVNPGGGGPRTLRGALWAARGKPDQVPSLPGVLLARCDRWRGTLWGLPAPLVMDFMARACLAANWPTLA